MARRYMTNEIHLAAYVSRNLVGDVQVLGETEHGYVIKTKAGVRQLQKNNIESWALNEGLIAGMGVDALPEHVRAIAAGNIESNTMRQRERASIASANDKNLQAYHNQTKETRAARAQAEVNAANTGPVEGVHYRGNFKYKGPGTNQ